VEPDDTELEKIKMRKMMEILSRGASDAKTEALDPTHPVDLNDQDFERFVSSYPLVVVDFWASWCAPCRFMAPIVKELAAEFGGKIAFGKLDVDNNPLTAAKYGIMSIPTFIIFKDGTPVDMIVGAMPKQRFKSLIMQHLS
jgi:thioredoxin 1